MGDLPGVVCSGLREWCDFLCNNMYVTCDVQFSLIAGCGWSDWSGQNNCSFLRPAASCQCQCQHHLSAHNVTFYKRKQIKHYQLLSVTYKVLSSSVQPTYMFQQSLFCLRVFEHYKCMIYDMFQCMHTASQVIYVNFGMHVVMLCNF